jgi:hypothetical protein
MMTHLQGMVRSIENLFACGGNKSALGLISSV